MIIEFSEDCPTGRNHQHCPFCIMSGLSYASLTNLVNNISREVCVHMFEQELQCRSQVKPPTRDGLASMSPI